MKNFSGPGVGSVSGGSYGMSVVMFWTRDDNRIFSVSLKIDSEMLFVMFCGGVG